MTRFTNKMLFKALCSRIRLKNSTFILSSLMRQALSIAIWMITFHRRDKKREKNIFWLQTCSDLTNSDFSTKQKPFGVFDLLLIFNPKHQCRLFVPHDVPRSASEWMGCNLTLVLGFFWLFGAHEIYMKWFCATCKWKSQVKFTVWRQISKRPGKANLIHLSYTITHKNVI